MIKDILISAAVSIAIMALVARVPSLAALVYGVPVSASPNK